MDSDEIQAALDQVFDQAIVFHGYTDYMRDYEVITYSTADPLTGIPPAYDRYLFRDCVRAEVETALTPAIWRRSLDDRLIDYELGKHLDGYVWGVKYQLLYPGAEVVADSLRAREWADALGTAFHEVRLETNTHNITLVFSGLTITEGSPGYAPFVVDQENHYVPPAPLQPDDRAQGRTEGG